MGLDVFVSDTGLCFKGEFFKGLGAGDFGLRLL